VNQLLLAAILVAGVQLSGAILQISRLQRHEYELSGGTAVVIGVAAVLVAGVAFTATYRPLRGVADTSVTHDLRIGGLAAVYAGLLLIIAAWSPALIISILAQLVAAAAIGTSAGATYLVLVDQIGGTRATLAAIFVVLGGMLLGFAGPVLMNSVAEFQRLREWIFERPHTVPGMRATLLFAAAAGLLAAGQLSRAASALLAQQANRAASGTMDPLHNGTRKRCHPGAPLEISGLDLSYGQLQVLFGVDLHVAEGETVALLGTNGAGKSSVLRAAFGLNRPSNGKVWSGQTDITGWSAERLARLGLLQVPGGKGVFPSLSVRDNLRMAAYPLPGARRVREGIDRAVDAFPRLAERLDQPAGVLSGGEQQMVALARAWVTRPKLLAIDELTLGLAPIVIDELQGFVRLLRTEGIPIIIVEQSVYVAFELCERAYFLERGKVRFEGRTADLMSRTDLLRSIFFEASTETADFADRGSR
jgi:ABC-type branched-subunit amino acid transport system ATPase component